MGVRHPMDETEIEALCERITACEDIDSLVSSWVKRDHSALTIGLQEIEEKYADIGWDAGLMGHQVQSVILDIIEGEASELTKGATMAETNSVLLRYVERIGGDEATAESLQLYCELVAEGSLMPGVYRFRVGESPRWPNGGITSITINENGNWERGEY